jgi:hypothetical protein
MIELPEHKDDKESGIKGLYQIAVHSVTNNTHEERMEIVDRYFTKFQNRMVKKGITLTEEECLQIRENLMVMINKER